MKKFTLVIMCAVMLSQTKAQTITTAPISGSFCAGSEFTISFADTIAFNQGNIFRAQLSDASGNFTNPVTIGSVSSIMSDTVHFIVPRGTSAGSGYRIRVTSTNPAIIGSDNGTDLTIYPTPVAPVLALPGGPCLGADSLSLSGALGSSLITWFRGSQVVSNTIPYSPTAVLSNDSLNYPTSVYMDASGNMYVTEQNNNRVQKFIPGGNPMGVTVAGGNGAGNAANQLNFPQSTFVDATGNLYIADQNNNRIQMFPAGSTSATNATTVAGGNGLGTDSNQLRNPSGVFVDHSGYIYVADQNNNRIQKFPVGSTSDSNGITIAGTGIFGGGPDQLNQPTGVFVDASGYVYIADFANNRIQKFAPNSMGGDTGITVAGGNGSGNAANQLKNPFSVYVDASGYIYVADEHNNRIQKFPPASGPATNGVTVAGSNADDTSANAVSNPSSVFVDASGNIYVASEGNSAIQRWIQGPIDTIYTPAASGVYTATYSSPAGCISAISNAVTVDSVVSPTVRIFNRTNPTCAAMPDSFALVSTYAGTSPSFDWYKNGLLQADSGNIYVNTNPANHDSVWVILTSSVTCAQPSGVQSNHYILTVTPTVTPTVTAAVSYPTLCSGMMDTFTATTTNGGSGATYQWYQDTVAVGTNSPTFITNSLKDNDSIWVMVTSSAICASPAIVTSNDLHLTVHPSDTPAVTLASPHTSTVCTGAPITILASSSAGGTAPLYNFEVNGVSVQNDTSSRYSSSSLINGDSVVCIITSNATCTISPTAMSNAIPISFIVPRPNPSISLAGTDTLTTTPGYVFYQWFMNGDTLSTPDSSAVYVASQNGTYTVMVVDTNGCLDTSAAFTYRVSGINNLSGATMQLYPNPNNGSFILETGDIGKDFTIYDVLGNAIIRQTIISAHQNVNLRNLAAGTYTVQIGGDNNKNIKFTIDQ